MESTSRANDRNAVFQQLKPCCVKISELAIRDAEKPAAHRELVSLTQQLLTILNGSINNNVSVLDEKLAEYVFFPLYHIFRQMDLFPMLLIEHCVKCLNILISHGWKAKISEKLVQQILGLLIFIVDGVPGKEKKRDIPEETILESFRALTALFNAASSSSSAAAALSESDTLPALGHAVTVMLDGVSKGATQFIQQEALRAIETVYTTLRDPIAQAQFLPGTISSLTRVLSTPTRFKNSIIVDSLHVMATVLTRVLGDMATRSIHARAERDADDVSEKNDLLTPAWLKATVGQVKLALSTIMKLRTSDSEDIRDALRSLCLKLLDECHKTLTEASPLLVETAVVLEKRGYQSSMTETSLADLVQIYPELGETVKTVVYHAISSLTRVLQSSDEDVKRYAIHNISSGIHLLQELRIDSSILDESISSTLRASVVLMMAGSKTSRQQIVNMDAITLQASGAMIPELQQARYQPVILGHESQRDTRREMLDLISVLSSHSEPSRIAMSMIEHAREGSPHTQVASFWICFELVKASQASSADTDALLNLAAFEESGDGMESVYEELYTFSVQILDSHTEIASFDWRLGALALEVTAYAARRSGASFRPELIDVLFPVVSFLGSEDPRLRQHTVTTLNGIAAACEYDSVSELIVHNVDYMVNSVALRLNTLDISPASTQVLTMMIHLTGPKLVPFLDDVVDSIFSALENYHGYPMFVESLFTVLKELVNQAVRSDMLLLEDQKKVRIDHRKQRLNSGGYKGLVEFLNNVDRQRKHDREEERNSKLDAERRHPTTPWGEESKRADNDEDQLDAPAPEEEKPPNSATYQLLLRITTLTQHYLTSPTPRLRRSLLELLSTASPALAADEDAFLPLVNAVWPVVISRLYDDESFIAVEACHALSQLCAAAGDFLASRFSTEWDDGLRKWCQKVKRAALNPYSQATSASLKRSEETDDKILIPTSGGELVQAKSSKPIGPVVPHSGLGEHASPFRVWEGVAKLLTSIISHVRVTDLMFEDILDLLTDHLEKSAEVREALETVNEDAVWVKRYERGTLHQLPTMPVLEGVVFTTI